MAFYFAWADEAETTFGPEHLVEDEEIVSATMEHVEKSDPTLTIVIRNPHVGLLSPGRQTWAWFSVDDGTGVEPVFFGQLVAIPSDLLGETATLIFIARAADHGAQKQAIAGTLKAGEGYDPIFVDPALQDDPDTVLEGYSKLWHIDRITLAVTVSDILVGEDGIEVFTEDEVPYSSVALSPAQAPLRSVHVDATVSWTQTGSGYVDVFADGPGSGTAVDPDTVTAPVLSSPGKRYFETYTGDGIIADWPKVGTQLQSGYSVAVGTAAIDVRNVAGMTVRQVDWTWTNRKKEHVTGDTLENKITASIPAGILASDPRALRMTGEGHGGHLDPFADPQINIPLQIRVTYVYTPKWKIETTLLLRYDVALQRTERLRFTLSSDLQAITTAGGDGDSEVISISGVDVGLPLLNVLNWLSVKGQAVALGQIIRTVLFDGTVAYQIATTAGTAGTVEPAFTDFLGDTTTDGTVVWTSLGTQLFSNDVPDWVAEDPTPLGQVIFPEEGSVYQLCTTDGETGVTRPSFNTTVGATTVDGTVIWTCLGLSGAFIGTPIGDTTRGVFFPTDRGTRAIEYLLSVARAHQMMRARAVTVSFECSFQRALGLSCRKNAQLFDSRLPGGDALGKIIAYTIQVDGPSGRMFGTVTMGCAIGKGNIVEAADGEPDYVDEDVLGPDVQVFLNSTIVLPSDDIGYTQPIDVPSSDDLYFPLTSDQVILHEEVHIGLPEQEAALDEATAGGSLPPAQDEPPSSTVEGTIGPQEEALMLKKKRIESAMRQNSQWYELTLRPLVGGPIDNRYDMDVTLMTVPRMIDLESGSVTS